MLLPMCDCGGGSTEGDTSGDKGGSDSGDSGDVSGTTNSESGGCDKTCQDALSALGKLMKGHQGSLYQSLAKELRKYVLTVAGNSKCVEGAMVTSGAAAGCADMAKTGSTATWNDLLNEWLNGKGGVRTFGAGSLLTQQLAGNKYSTELLAELQKKISGAGYDISPNDPDAKLGGVSKRKDPKSNILRDITGMLTDGQHGASTPEAFFGSYDQVHQVINVDKQNRSFTVAFAAYNATGMHSLTHFWPDVAQGRQMANLHQTYYWTVTVTE